MKGTKSLEDLEDRDFTLSLDQKGVDMEIGLDIASLAYKKQVDQIILISGDSDFVPAAKFAWREGIDFILDPMWADIEPDLFEHSDGLRSPWEKSPCDDNHDKDQDRSMNQEPKVDDSSLLYHRKLRYLDNTAMTLGLTMSCIPILWADAGHLYDK